MTTLWELLLTFAELSLLAVGGANAVVPEMHRQIVETHHWLDHARFVQLYALSQAAPGPNILSASAVGFGIAGLPGMIVATIGIVGPAAALAWIMAGLTQRLSGAWWLKPAQAGLVPVAIGLFLSSGLIMAGTNGEGRLHLLAVVVVGALVVWRTNWNPLWVLGAGAVAGLLLG